MEFSKAFLLSTLCTFLSSCVGQDTSVPLPEFVTHPKEYSYLAKDKPVTLTCEAYDAMEITFNCLGAKVDTDRQKTYQSFHPDSGRILVKATIDVDYNDVQGAEDYSCECYAWAQSGGDDEHKQYALSNRGFVMIPYLEKVFLEEPENQVVEEGSEVELRCVPPEGNPEPRIVWKKNGHKINPDKDTNLHPTRYGTLLITNFQMTDEGEYSCVAQNLAGKQESRAATLTVQDYIIAETHLFSDELADEPQGDDAFVQLPEAKYYVTDNAPEEMTCAVKGAEILEFRCNGARIDEAKIDKDVTNPRGGPERLIKSIYKITARDILQYKRQYNQDYSCLCYAWFIVEGNWQGKETKASKFLPAEIGSRFGADLEDMEVSPGSTVTFTCQPPSGSPKPKVFWLKDGQRLSKSSNIVMKRNSLTFNKVSASDAGEITCVAQNKAGAQRNSAILSVSDDAPYINGAVTEASTTKQTEPPSGTPYFTQKLEKFYHTFTSQPAMLKCAFKGASILTVRCNEVRLPQDRLKIEQDYNRETDVRTISTSVDITFAEVRDFTEQGQDFSCMCVAWFTQPDGTWQTVEGESADIFMGFLESNFVVEPSDMTKSAGNNVVFECVPPIGGPDPTVSWNKDGADLDTSNKRYEVGGDGSLTIFDLTVDDTGSYMCVAQNGAGTRRSKAARLTVEGDVGGSTDTVVIDPETEAPQPETTMEPQTTTTYDLASGKPIFFRKPEKVSYIIRNRPATITCRTLGAEYLTFECNGKRIPEAFEDTYSEIEPETNRKILERSINVTREEFEEAGDLPAYVCKCSAWYADAVIQGWGQLDMEGAVEIAYLRKRFQTEPASQTAESGAAVEFECRPPNANPKATISWEKDGVAVDPEADQNIMVSDTGSLMLNSVSITDEGNYSCVAENIVGNRVSMAAELSVTGDITVEPEPTKSVDPVVAVATGGPPVFVEELEQTNFVVTGQTVTLRCSATETGKITFMCNNEDVEDDLVMLKNKDLNGEMVLEASLEIASTIIEEANAEYTCECLAWYKLAENEPDQYVGSTRGYVELAYIDKEFSREPKSQTVIIGQMATFRCVVPKGFPRPETFWSYNGERINLVSNDNIVMPNDGSLVIVQARASDAGAYSCSASNMAGTRTTKEAMLTVQGVGTSSMPEPEPEPETTTEMLYVNVTDDAANVTSEVTAEPEATTEHVMEGNVTLANTTFYNEIGSAVVTAEPEPGRTDKAVVEVDCKFREKCLVPFNPDQNMFNIHDSCPALQDFLKCVHDVKVMCNGLDSSDMDATLTDIADWFFEYCGRLPPKQRVVEKCASYNSCPAPVVPETTLSNLIDTHYWCKYIQMTTECRQLALADSECKVMKKNKLKMDLHYLETQAAKFCVKGEVINPLPEVTKPVTDIPGVVDSVDEVKPENSATATTTSLLVSTLVQFLVMLIISFR